jgi:hypothetical protein
LNYIIHFEQDETETKKMKTARRAFQNEIKFSSFRVMKKNQTIQSQGSRCGSEVK